MTVEKFENLMQALADASQEYQAAAKQYEDETNAWWEALSYDDKLRAFYSVVKRIHDGDVVQQGSYRYVLYEVFGFDADSYGIGMECGYMSLHNAIKTREEEQVLREHRAAKHKAIVNKKVCRNKDENGSCSQHNLHCNYPDCEKA
jgi:hypothetical protein